MRSSQHSQHNGSGTGATEPIGHKKRLYYENAIMTAKTISKARTLKVVMAELGVG